MQQSRVQSTLDTSDSFERISGIASNDVDLDDSQGAQSKGEGQIVLGEEVQDNSKKTKRTLKELETETAADKIRGKASASHDASRELEHKIKRPATELQRAFPDVEVDDQPPALPEGRPSSTSLVAAGGSGSDPPGDPSGSRVQLRDSEPPSATGRSP